MAPHLKLFDSAVLSSLMDEFRSSMRTLLRDLCDDLETHYRRPVASLRLPVDYFRFVGDSLKPDDYSTWKVVGWIEELNDLLYFIDLHKQLLAERHPRAFAADLMAECQEKFYENSYQDDIFPRGKPEPAGLAPRLSRLCARLARQVTQESLFLVPGLPCLWLAQTRKGAKQLAWPLSCDLRANFERAELPGRVYVGREGAYLDPPVSIRKKLTTVTSSASFLIGRDGIRLAVGRERFPLWSRERQPPWQWNYVPPCSLGLSQMTLGAALLYRKDLTPSRIVLPQPGLEKRIRTALAVIERAWPEGARTLALLTSRIIPLDAKGVVSFSYRNRPGLSFINTFARDRFDLIDDLIHENSHHHLNLLLRKYDMKRGDRNQEIFYSPWRRSLRPLHGILHATFTFTMGAILFERLSSSQASGLGAQALLRARFRCLEEVESVGYSIRDLTCAADQLGWLSPSGVALVRELARQIARVRRRIAPFRDQVLRSRYGPALRQHVRTLARARTLYGKALR
jgi:HEXXH motif-containing protein